ncbi:MAG: serine--tRNA ligase [Coxiella sp. (in: Bacteria)]|nr:MAG: serine--tRNA ligase [Coxiella sp. (in: g-proteobacteria)]
MLENEKFRQSIDDTAVQLARRGFKLDVGGIKVLEAQRKQLQMDTQALQNERNTRSKAIGKAKASGDDIEPLLKEVGDLGDKLKTFQKQTDGVLAQLKEIQLSVPNILHDSVPDGKTENDNVEVRRWGDPMPNGPKVKDHVDLGEQLGMMDFAVASKITGSRFVVLKDGLARLQRALIQFMMDVQVNEHGYSEVYVPFLVNKDSLYGTGQLPKFADDQFNVAGEWDYSLIPTAEVPVTNLVRDTITDAAKLPLKYVAQTPCFRSEAGSYGKDTRGMIRLHQFEKVEMVRIVKPDESYQHLEEIVANAEALLQKLELPYRVIVLCAGDTGSNAAKTYDLEVWVPSQDTFREVSSCSNFEDFQARRMQARWRNPETGKPELVHTLNGSGLPTSRTLVAIIENYQNDDGSIRVPDVLQPYMSGLKVIKKVV